MQRRLVLVLTLILLGGCGQVGGLFELMEVAQAVETELADRHGLKCTVLANKVNGRLDTVSVVLPQEEVSDLSIGEMAALVQPTVLRHFKEMPESLVISVVIGK